MKRLLVASMASTLALVASAASASGPVTRQEVITRARAYAYHPWSSTAANQTASCKASYKSLYQPGDWVGVAYDWGGYMSLFEFDKEIASGYGAGAQETDGILDCTAGVDCSGFVSQAWGSGHFTTSDLDQTSSQITAASMLPGDVFNMAGYHVAMFTSSLASGAPSMIEALGYNVHVNTTGGWSHVNGYVPRRYTNIVDSAVADPVGTPTNPIVVGAFPFTDAKDTRQSPSNALGGCGLAPSTNEAGPEYVYKMTFTQPGTLTVTSSDDASADIDVELFTTLTTEACVARNDTTFTKEVGCGTYYVVADTFNTSANAGNFNLSMTFAPSGQACGAVPGPAPFNPKGKLGDACAYPGHTDLPFCNDNLGADTCIYSSTSSFCSKPCATDGDCAAMPGGGCCKDISGKGELYCLAGAQCGGAGSSGSSGASSSGGASSGGASSGGASSGGASGGDGNGAAPGDPSGGYAPEGQVNVDQGGGCSTTGAPRGGVASAAAVAFAALVAASRRRARKPSARRGE